MTVKLFFEAVIKFLLGVALVSAILFISAGTLLYLYGWIFMGVLFIPMLIAGVVMMVKNPSLLASRLKAKESKKGQGVLIKLSGLMFIVGFVLAGLDFRFGWLPIPPRVSYVSAVVFLFGYLVFAEVLRENAYLSRTIRVEEGQTVVDTGLYSVVRHPMYTATLILFLSMPLVLGSVIALPVFCLYPVLIIFRIKGEEKLLEAELVGYTEYKKKTKYRLIPYVW
jgi:protein-S-isoprenylcysteine O-methyltransferase Ste14